MHAINDLLSTDYGLMSVGVIAFTMVMAAYIAAYVARHVKEEAAKHDAQMKKSAS